MRKLILASATILLLSSSAFAGGRGLSSEQAAEPQKPFHQAEVTVLQAPAEQPPAAAVEPPLRVDPPPLTVEQKLKAAGEIKSDTPAVVTPVQAPAPVQAQPLPAPVQAQAPVPVQAQAPVQALPAPKPVKTQVAKRRESDEQKARRIAARYGISW